MPRPGLILAPCLQVLSLLAIQPVMAQCTDCPPLPTITGVRFTSYNRVVWDLPADTSIVYGYYVYWRIPFADGSPGGWSSSLVDPPTRSSFTISGLSSTVEWVQGYVYASPRDPNQYRRSLIATYSSACHGPCPEPVHSRINWFPPSTGGGAGTLVMDHRLNQHAAAPVAMYRNPAGERLELWGVVSAREGLPLVEVLGIAALTEAGHAGGELASMTNPASDKPIVVTWLPDSGEIEVSTYYADLPPYQIDKPYVYRIDGDDRGTIVAW